VAKQTESTNGAETSDVVASQEDEAVAKEGRVSNSPASSKQTWAIFTQTQVDVRSLDPALTVSEASDLLEQVFTARDNLKKKAPVKFKAVINGLRDQLIASGGVDKRPQPTSKDASNTELVGVRRFDLGTADEQAADDDLSKLSKADLLAKVQATAEAEATETVVSESAEATS